MFAGVLALVRRRALSALRCCSPSDAPSWPAHFYSAAAASERVGPPPIRVSLTESAGRGVFATREIAAGELIHSANPLVVHPSLSILDKVCYYCLGRFREAPSPALGFSAVEESDNSKITASYFCSESCRELSKDFFEIERRLDWSSFHQYCSLKRLKYPLMVKRLACMIISGAASIDGLDILQPASLHPEIIAEMEEEFQLLEDTFGSGQLKNDMTFLTKEWYINVLARIRINAFRIELVSRSYEEMLSSAVAFIAVDAAVGNAIYMLPSFYNHDCDPNTHIIWLENANAKLKALRHIEEGEELRICYIDTSMDFEARQKFWARGLVFSVVVFDAYLMIKKQRRQCTVDGLLELLPDTGEGLCCLFDLIKKENIFLKRCSLFFSWPAFLYRSGKLFFSVKGNYLKFFYLCNFINYAVHWSVISLRCESKLFS